MEEVARTVYNWDEAKAMLYHSQRPVAIVAICADNSVRNQFVYSTLEKTLGITCFVSTSCTSERLRTALRGTDAICISMTPQDACSHARRHAIVDLMRKTRIKSVYGIYLHAPVSVFAETQAAIDALEADPPTVDGLDGLIIL